jgi:hypothetical protein
MSSYTVVSAPVEDEAVVKQVLARMDTMQALTDEWMKPDGWHKDGEKVRLNLINITTLAFQNARGS